MWISIPVYQRSIVNHGISLTLIIAFPDTLMFKAEKLTYQLRQFSTLRTWPHVLLWDEKSH